MGTIVKLSWAHLALYFPVVLKMPPTKAMLAAEMPNMVQDAFLMFNKFDLQPWDDFLIGCLIVCLAHRLADWLTDSLLDRWIELLTD